MECANNMKLIISIWTMVDADEKTYFERSIVYVNFSIAHTIMYYVKTTCSPYTECVAQGEKFGLNDTVNILSLFWW